MCNGSEKDNGLLLEPPTKKELRVQGKLSLVLEMCWLGLLILPSILLAVYRTIFPPPGKSLAGQVALVTGAGRGLGKGLAMELAREGCRVAVADINLENAQQTADEIIQLGGKAKAFPVNVAKVKDIRELHSAIKKELGPVDLLVNNAGLIYGDLLLDQSDEDIQAVLDVNLASHFWMVREFLPGMKERNHGHVVAIASIASFMGLAKGSAYAACKFGVRGFMDSLRDELREDVKNNIQTTTVYPYFINTSATYMDHWDIRIPALSISEVVERTVVGIKRDETSVTVPDHLYLLVNIMKLLPQDITDLIRKIFYVRLTPPTPTEKEKFVACLLAKEYKTQ